MNHVSRKTRRAALTLSFKQKSKVVDSVIDLEAKLLDKSNSTQLTVAAVTTKTKDVCRYCKIKTQHHEKRCYKKSRQKKRHCALCEAKTKTNFYTTTNDTVLILLFSTWPGKSPPSSAGQP